MKARHQSRLPVVAHRILGAEYIPESMSPYAKIPAYEEDGRWIAWSETHEPPERTPPFESGEGRMKARTDSDTQEYARATFIRPGTRRSVEEIRDFFDGGRRAETTGDANVNQIWASADIEFQLVAIVDHAIRSTWSVMIDADNVKYIVRDLNQPNMVNIYFFREISGASGTSGFSPVPLQETRINTAFAAVEDWEDMYGDLAWDYTVRTLAHELGHLLKLRHHEDESNLMWPWISPDAHALLGLQKMVAHEHSRHYLEESHRRVLRDRVFRRHFMDKDSEPKLVRAYLGERLGFD